MAELKFEAVIDWAGVRTSGWKKSQFSAPFKTTLDLLAREIFFLPVRSATLRAAFKSSDMKLDGFPRSGATPVHPGVLLVLNTTREGVLLFPCDTFDRWIDNVRAIALVLEMLRKQEKYGVGKQFQQYRAYKAIEAGAEEKKAEFISFGSAIDAARFILKHALVTLPRMETNFDYVLNDAYRAAAIRLHPDTATGSHVDFVNLQEAKSTIEDFVTSTKGAYAR